ncbi:MAG TPA: cytochrome b/b6 domain-containing protein [Candidatus Sulfotelmatobacter sp.]|nr:cytochrome b/b6 domain-containing protein [Candidatus Sulfotelmatobacter sp.]
MTAVKHRRWLIALGFLVAFAFSCPGARAASDQDCLACHGDATMKSASGRSLHVDAAKFKGSMHASLGCTDCHVGVKEYPHPQKMRLPKCSTCHEEPAAQLPASVHSALGPGACASCHGTAHEVQAAETLLPQRCATCHEDAVHGYQLGVHAIARKDGDGQAPTCTACHGGPHQILAASDPNSPVSHVHIPTTCAKCHGQKFVMERAGFSTQPFYSYEESVHGRAVAAGSTKAAVCTDCHGVHEIRAASDDKSSIFKFNVPATCAKCHTAVEQEFMQSIHGQAISKGNSQAPVCTDCHGIHSIKSHIDPNSPVSAQNVAQATCARCHEGVRLSQEFGVEGRRETTYLASYHGLASREGSQVVANCASCHGTHSIFPSNDPRSTINRANLARTCGQCHPGVTEKFTEAKVHVGAPLSADIGSKAVRWIRGFYLSMIFAVIGGMLAHNFIIWRAKLVARRKVEHDFVERMPLRFRWQHAALLSSVILLVLTGFALKFPDSWFASMLALGEQKRHLLHRIAAVVLIGVSLYHMFDSVATREGRKLLRDLFPTLDDVRGAWQNLSYYLGLTQRKPEFARFNYAEKAEYWALVWGMVVMAVTGVMLWAKVSVGNHLPRWWLDIATAIHFYEAVLATLAIVVWHFYQVFLDPDVYPMNWAWWDGRMTLHHYREEHGLDQATLTETLDISVAAAVVDVEREQSESPEVKHGH